MPKVNLTHYQGREQAFVKHYLLKKYLSKWGIKIGSKWDTLVFVDGFAGPWGAKDIEFSDASFGIALKALTEAVSVLDQQLGRSVHGTCVFVEKKPTAFARLNAFAKSHSTQSVSAIALRGRFSKNIPAINHYVSTVGNNPFKFVFLDQKGWAATPMRELRPFIKGRPCELLFNLMTSFLTRFVNRKELAPSYNDLFGRPGVVEQIRALPKGTGQREEMAVEEYCRSLREICGFKYVSRAVILDPEKEKVRYYLVFATNSLHGIEVFKSAESEATKIQDDVRFQIRVHQNNPTLPGLFDNSVPQSRLAVNLATRYKSFAKQKIVEILMTEQSKIGIPYSKLFGEAMSFPIVTATDLIEWLNALKPSIEIKYATSTKRRNPRRPSPLENDQIVVIDHEAIAKWKS